MTSVFITGTDTGCGKTYIASALLRELARRGRRCAAFKPFVSGARRRRGQLVFDDIENLRRAAAPDQEQFSVYEFAAPLAPHIAAQHSGAALDLAEVLRAYQRLRDNYDTVIVEGIGGLMVPLTAAAYVIDLIAALNIPVIIVTPNRLGTLNTTMLSARLCAQYGLAPLCYILNEVSRQPRLLRDSNYEFLAAHAGAPVERVPCRAIPAASPIRRLVEKYIL